MAQCFDVRFTLQGVGVMLRKMGISPQRPLYRAHEQYPEAVQRCKTQEYPKLRAEVANVGVRIFFQDEAAPRRVPGAPS